MVSRYAEVPPRRSTQGAGIACRGTSRRTGHSCECRAWSSLLTTTAAERRRANRADSRTAAIAARLSRVGGSHRSKQGEPLLPEFRSPQQGAATHVWAATSARLAGQGGAYCNACRVVRPVDTAHELDQAARLWTLSAELTGVDAFAPAR